MIVEINNIPFGKVEASTPEHEVLSTFARNYMMKHGLHKKRGFFRKFWGGIKLSYLVERLEPYGWGVGEDGVLYPVPVKAVGDQPASAVQPPETDADIVREGIVNSGYVIDPQTGRKLPPSERHRWGA